MKAAARLWIGALLAFCCRPLWPLFFFAAVTSVRRSFRALSSNI